MPNVERLLAVYDNEPIVDFFGVTGSKLDSSVLLLEQIAGLLRRISSFVADQPYHHR